MYKDESNLKKKKLIKEITASKMFATFEYFDVVCCCHKTSINKQTRMAVSIWVPKYARKQNDQNMDKLETNKYIYMYTHVIWYIFFSL